MSKTVKEWFEGLPEPYRTQALENLNCPEHIAYDMSDAIGVGFVWENTSQGHEYWLDLAMQYDRDEITLELLGKQISSIINQPGGDYTDGQVLDEVISLLKKHNLYTEHK
jgi:hypothetical protein